MPNVSVFGNIYDTDTKDDIDIDAVLFGIQNGKWEDQVTSIRIRKNKKERDKIKESIDRVSYSGVFSKRADTGLLEHSGFIALDYDSLEDPENIKIILSQDKYTYACFLSTSGTGLCALYRIQPQKHREAFLGLAEYMLENYGLIVDPQSVSVSKPFCVTFDPNIYISDKITPVFTRYPKEKKVEKITNFAFAQDDFDKILKELIVRRINICEAYDQWLKIGFAFVDKFGENGRQYYHMVSQMSEKYNEKRTDKQYDYCLKGKNLKVATISTFYYYCKEQGIQITSERTSKIRKATLNSKAAGLNKEQIIKNLEKFEGITGADELISQIFDGVAQMGDGESLVEQLELFVSANYTLERNIIKRFIEREGVQLEQRDLNSMYISALKTLPTLHYQLFERLIMSDFIKNYNPLHRFLEALPVVEVKNIEGEFISPNIDKLASSIINDIQPYTQYFFRKWLVSSISAAYGEHSPLMFVLSGETQGKGKTEFFRRLLPNKIRDYYAESKLDAGKDDEILMTQKWFIMDDEMSGKSKRESQRLKELTSKQWFSLREPYGRINVDLMRLAILCATSNSKQLLHDDTGNRRIIPVPVDDINKEIYNSVDKELLFAEAYQLWRQGFEWRVLGEDIEYLRLYESDFEAIVGERELMLKYFSKERPNEVMSTTEIKVDLERLTNQRLSLDMLGKQISKLKYTKKSVKVDGESSKKWCVRKINREAFIPPKNDDKDEEDPF